MDLKPENIVLLTEGPQLLLAANVDELSLKLIDFGGALAYDKFSHPPFVEVENPVSSPHYAGPELTSRKAHERLKKVGKNLKSH
jgi:serine/threonine protein kinase